MSINWGSALLSGAIRTIPLATGLVAWTAARDRGWGSWASAFAASGVAVAAGVGAYLLEGQVASQSLESAVQTQLGLTGLTTPEDIRRAGYFGQTISTPEDIRRAGYFGRLGGAQRVPPAARFAPRGPLGALQVSRSFRRYS